MKQYISDPASLIRKNWKSISVIVILAYLIRSYPDIKQGVLDGWLGR